MSEAIQKVEGKEKDIRKFHPLYRDLDENDILGVGVPQRKITISDSSQSVGLQIVDVYLWIANRLLQGKELSGELQHVGSVFFKSTLIDGISIQGMLNRFKEFEEKLPALNALTKEQFAMYFEKVDQHREKVKRLF